jgi:hypothetical protein
MTAPPSDPSAEVIAADVDTGAAHITVFFNMPFAAPVHVIVAADRENFDRALPAAWGLTPTQCWMVGVGVAQTLYVLSPRVWRTQACEHDSANSQEVQDLVTHELTHAFHGQHNPTRDFTGMDDEGWFVEGLAVLVSGQLEREHQGDAAAAIAANAAPTKLADAWSGRYRYGVSGSMAAYIDAVWGRRVLVDLLSATTNQRILARLGCTEADFIARWRVWVTATPAQH